MPTPVVYISSSAADAAFSGRLAAALERAGATVARGTGGPPAAGLTGEAEQALADADACVVILSAAALASERVERETARFHELRAPQPQRLLVPVLLAGVDPTDVWPFLLGYPPLSATGTGVRGDDALIADVLRRLDPLLQVDTVVMPVIPTPGAIPAGLDLAKGPLPLVGGGVEDAETAVMPAAAGGLPGHDIANAGTARLPTAGTFEAIAAAGDVHSRRSSEWGPDNRRNGILILAGGLLALTLCVALSLGLLEHNRNSGNRAGQDVIAATSTNTAGQTPSLIATASTTRTATVTASTTSTASPTSTATQGAAPSGATATATPNPGLWGDYYTTTSSSPGTPAPTYPAQITRICHEVDPNINYPTRKSFGCSALTNSNQYTSGFSVKWYGYISVPTSGTYTFYTYSDDGISVIVNGQQLIYDWTVHWPTWDCSTNANPMLGPTPAPTPNPSGCKSISLNAGQLYPIEVDYYENDEGGATIQLCWQAPDLQHNIIPASAFSH